MTFRTTATILSMAAFLLAIAYLFAGSMMVGRWEIEPTESVLLLGRRIGGMYVGLSVMLFLARNAPSSPARRALSGGLVVWMTLLAALGTMDFLGGRAAAPILVTVALEVLVAIAFAVHFLNDRRTTS